MEDSVAAKSKLPTKMFFISVVCLSIVRARLGRFGPRPVLQQPGRGPNCLQRCFSYRSAVFQSCALDSADLDLGQVVAGLSKGSLSIAGHCQPAGMAMRNYRGAPPHYFTATSQIFSRLDLPSAPSTSRVTV